MSEQFVQISQIGRGAVQKQDWNVVHQAAQQLIDLDPQHPEGHFLYGLLENAAQHPRLALAALEKALELDQERYDAAIELANQYINAARNKEAIELLDRYTDKLGNSPRYLDMAGTSYATLGLPERAWPLYIKANELQPDIDLFRSNLASCAVFLGKIDEAEAIYRALLVKHPDHQRNHYHLSRLRPAESTEHIAEMLAVLERTALPPERNVFLYYALGKEYEDLGQWDEAFSYFKAGGDAISSVANYDPAEDLGIIDAVITHCTQDWLKTDPVTSTFARTPIFVLGLPRTGSTLTERIISSHSQVNSIGETTHFETVLRLHSGVESTERMNAEMIGAVAGKNLSGAAADYLAAVEYSLADEPYFLEKLPYNFLYAGFLAKAFPEARIVYVKRNPLDACFAMYKQVFTWAYKFSYNLENLADYFIAHTRLLRHYESVLGDRLIVVEYESMVQDQEAETRRLLDQLGLPFEEQCLSFESNAAASTTASSVQVRQPIHSRSVANWTHFSAHLEPLSQRLTEAGIDC